MALVSKSMLPWLCRVGATGCLGVQVAAASMLRLLVELVNGKVGDGGNGMCGTSGVLSRFVPLTVK